MKFASMAFPIILLAMTSQANAFCQIGDTQNCFVNGKPGIKECDPQTHQLGPCQVFGGTGPVTGTVRPRYYILTVVYAPPGTQGTGRSSVSYGQGSSTGTTTSASHSFKQDYSISATTKISGADLSIGASFGYARNTSNTQALDIKKSAKRPLPRAARLPTGSTTTAISSICG